MLANLAAACEAVLVEEFDSRAEQESPLGFAVGGYFGYHFDEPAPELGDLVKSALQRGPGNTLASMLPVNVEAGDPPVWNWRGVLVVLAFVFDVRQFLGAAVLAPSLSGALLIKNERSVGAAGAHAVFLDGAMTDPVLPQRLIYLTSGTVLKPVGVEISRQQLVIGKVFEADHPTGGEVPVACATDHRPEVLR
jgi:hypothetical protein